MASFTSSRSMNMRIHVFVFTLLAILWTCSAKRKYGCSAVRGDYEKLGFRKANIPMSMVSGEHLRVCTQGFTCCTSEMENQFSTKSRQNYDKIMADKIGLIRDIFVSRTAKFDDFFTELLKNARRDLHEMFVKTYGLLYQQNSYVFTDLFTNLEEYFEGKNINLMDVLNQFFTTLMQKMFQLLNSQYKFDQNYLDCVAEHMDDLKPFGDVPQKMSVQVKRAFVAARTLVQALAVGREVIFATSKLPTSSSCARSLMRMYYCPYCRNLVDVKPCNNYCMNIMKGCLANHAELNMEWNAYIGALVRLAERLEGPFNIESVVGPMDVKISDAIMNFQESSEEVSAKVLQGCGQPRMMQKRDVNRYIDDSFHINDNMQSRRGRKKNGKSRNKGKNDRDHDLGELDLSTTAAGTSLDRLVRDIRNKVEVAKDFWRQLPHSICNNVAAKVNNEETCWNGVSKGMYLPEVVGDGIAAQNNNPEVEVNVRKQSSVISHQISQLKLIVTKLKSAYNGEDVTSMVAPDHAEPSGDYDDTESSGSGDRVNDDDDDEDYEVSGASGYGYYPKPGRGGKSRYPKPEDDWEFDPPVVQTRRPPWYQEGYNNDQNYNREKDYYHRSSSATLLSTWSLLYVLSLLLATVSQHPLWHC